MSASDPIPPTGTPLPERASPTASAAAAADGHAAAIHHSINAARATVDALEARCGPAIAAAATAIVHAFQNTGHLWIFGNGGSAADAQHITAELAGRFLRERRALPATALTTNSSALTAIANDYGYDAVFARQLDGVCRSGDVVLGISTSGRSANVVTALALGRRLGARTIALTGEAGRDCAPAADILIAVPATATPRIQECHLLVGHILCDIVERTLFPPE